MTEMNFKGKVALVTGAGSGLGMAYAELLAEKGAAVVVNDPGLVAGGEQAGRYTADECVHAIAARGGRAVANYDSVATEVGAARMVAQAVDSFGGLDIVINNAGISSNTPFEELAFSDFETLMAIHFFGTVLVTKAAWDHLKASGRGRVVNTISSGIFGIPGRAAYGAAKGAILGFTRSLAVEAGQHGICVNMIAPGAATNMTMTSGHGEEFRTWIQKTLPVSAVAPVAAYLAHEDCTLQGEMLSALGGRVSRYLLGETEGIFSSDLTLEQVRDDIEKIMDGGSFIAYANTQDSIERAKGNK